MVSVKYVVTLTGDEREDLLAVVDRGRAPATQTRHANIPLAIDRGEHAGPGMTDAQAAAACHSTTQTVRTARRRLVEEGLGRAIRRRRRERPGRVRTGGEAEARIVAPARADPPEGHAKRALRPVAEKSAGLGVPRVLVPDSCETAIDRAGAGVTEANDAYGRFAGHHGCGIPPARVRRPRDKGLAEGTASIAGRWAIAPSREPCLRDLDELDDCLGDGVDWPSAREVPDCGASRDKRPLEGLPRLPPPSPSRHEVCGWCRPRVAPDHHVRVGHMRHSVPLALVGDRKSVV